MKNILPRFLRSVWSSTRYDSPELTRFARKKSVEEARRGLVAMSVVIMGILAVEALFYIKFALDPMYLYTSAILVLLSLNMVFSARAVDDPRALHLLGVTLLVVSGSAFVLLAHYQGNFHPMLFASVAMLFIVVPMMSWGLGEGLAVTLLIAFPHVGSSMKDMTPFLEQVRPRLAADEPVYVTGRIDETFRGIVPFVMDRKMVELEHDEVYQRQPECVLVQDKKAGESAPQLEAPYELLLDRQFGPGRYFAFWCRADAS